MSGAAANMYGVIGQPLTTEYLASQLPLFQQRVPRGTQVCECVVGGCTQA